MKYIRNLRWLFPALWSIRLNWIEAAALGLQIAGTGYGIYGSKQAEKKAKDQAKHDAQLSRRASEIQVESIVSSKTGAEAQAAQGISDLARNAMLERGRILAGAAEAGVAGGSVSGQLLNSYFHEADARGRELYNLKAYEGQANRDISSAQLGLQVNLPRYQRTTPNATSQILAGSLQALQIVGQSGWFDGKKA